MSLSASLPARGAWIEIELHRSRYLDNASLPARGAWIEMFPAAHHRSSLAVAPRKGSVD